VVKSNIFACLKYTQNLKRVKSYKQNISKKNRYYLQHQQRQQQQQQQQQQRQQQQQQQQTNKSRLRGDMKKTLQIENDGCF